MQHCLLYALLINGQGSSLRMLFDVPRVIVPDKSSVIRGNGCIIFDHNIVTWISTKHDHRFVDAEGFSCKWTGEKLDRGQSMWSMYCVHALSPVPIERVVEIRIKLCNNLL